MSSENQNGYRVKCPSCGAAYWYDLEKIDENGSVRCQNCAKRISVGSAPVAYTSVSADTDDAIVPSRRPFLTLTASEGVRVKCPNCGAKYIYKDQQKQPDGRVQCQNCGVTIGAVGEEVVVYNAPAESDKTENTMIIVIIILILLFVPIPIAVPVVVIIAAFEFCSATKTESEETGFYTESGQGPSLR